MGFPDYKRDLCADDFDDGLVLDRYFHTGQSFAFQGARPEEESLFKRDVSKNLYDAISIELHPLQLIVCGSAHLGFSPVPSDEKFGRPFNSMQSDIDIAIVSTELFDKWWTELQSSRCPLYLQNRLAADLFWGFINPANACSVSKTGQLWWDVFGSLQTDRAKGVRGRLYRNFWTMQNYHRYAINGGRSKLLGLR